jgi:nucleotide-binding universal stress UspA family protein
MTIRRMLVAAKFSSSDPRRSDYVLDFAVDFARRFGASIDLVHVRSPLAPAPTDKLLPSAGDREAMLDVFDQVLSALSERALERGVACVTTSLRGRPATRIVRHARKTGSDIIVLGSCARRAMPHGWLGHTSKLVLHRAACPVVIVPWPPP